MAIILTRNELTGLYVAMHPVNKGRCQCSCFDCPAPVHIVCDLLETSVALPERNTSKIHKASMLWREYTDSKCDTYTCPNCPDYSWCTTLRGIAIEGVRLGE